MGRRGRGGCGCGTFFIILIFLLLVGLFRADIYLPLTGALSKVRLSSNLQTEVDSYRVVDLSNDRVLAEYAVDRKVQPASLAKLFTLSYVRTQLKEDEIIKVKKDVLALVPKGASKADLKPGETYYVKELYAALMIPSGCDAAYILADAVGTRLHPKGGVKQHIATYMKAFQTYLTKQGWNDTLMHEPSGYDHQAKSSLRDVERVIRHLWEDESIRKMARTHLKKVDTEKGRHEWKNTNKFLDTEEPYYNENVIGFKTGSLDVFNLAVILKNDRREILLMEMGAKDDDARYQAIKELIQGLD